MTTLLQSYASYLAQAGQSALTATVKHHAKRALLDWMGALIAGSDLSTADLLRKAFADELVPLAPCSIVGTDLKANLRAAAFLNGSLSHLAEYDDIYRDGAYHPASPTISPAFALAQARGLGRDALLMAITAGYEVSTRISAAVTTSIFTRPVRSVFLARRRLALLYCSLTLTKPRTPWLLRVRLPAACSKRFVLMP
jgi:2-methylcitrate dehydratase PrpD